MPVDRGQEIRNGERHVLHAGAAMIQVEEIDLGRLEEGLRRFVVRELQPGVRIPHHDRFEPRAAELALLHVLRVKLDLPEALEPHHLFHPGEGRLEREKVRCQVVHVGDAETIRAAARGVEADQVRHDRRPAFVLYEAKQCVAQRRCDIEPGHDAAFDRPPLEARDRRRAALGQRA